MRKMSGADAHFLSEETRTQHSHTIKVQVVDTSGAHAALTFEEFRRAFEGGLSLIPPFQWRLVSMPLRLAHPRWYYDPNLDLDYHLRRAAVPAPGGPRELAEVISHIASTGLERDRPLWQMWFVEGLEHGHIAFVTKLHHSVADGSSSAQILLDAFQRSPEDHVQWPPHESQVAEPVPPRWRLLLQGLWELAVLIAGLPRLAWRALRMGWIVLQRRRAGLPRPVSAFDGPRVRFNRRLTPHRWFATVDVPLASFKKVKGAFGCTLNDVFIAVCSGAIRRYLDLHGELPMQSLTAYVPVSIRKKEELRAYGNRLTNWHADLATSVDDPVERLRRIQRSTAAARDQSKAADPELFNDYMDYWWLYRITSRLVPKIVRLISGRPAFNVILSNVHGPDEPLYSEGMKVVALQSMGPIVDYLGLNMTGWSYVDTMSIGVVACREHVPDIWELAERVPEALEELVVAAEEASRQPIPPSGARVAGSAA
jgi:diacylglycerol O-acyltransferase